MLILLYHEGLRVSSLLFNFFYCGYLPVSSRVSRPLLNTEEYSNSSIHSLNSTLSKTLSNSVILTNPFLNF
nr:MAG TPA: hypothetical protein [Herelleviridae sp.]